MSGQSSNPDDVGAMIANKEELEEGGSDAAQANPTVRKEACVKNAMAIRPKRAKTLPISPVLAKRQAAFSTEGVFILHPGATPAGVFPSDEHPVLAFGKGSGKNGANLRRVVGDRRHLGGCVRRLAERLKNGRIVVTFSDFCTCCAYTGEPPVPPLCATTPLKLAPFGSVNGRRRRL